MRIGINEVILHDRSDGNRQRELNVLPTLLEQLQTLRHDVLLYVSRNLSIPLMRRRLGNGGSYEITRTPLRSTPTYQRTIVGGVYWANQVKQDGLDLFHTAYYPVPRIKVPVVLTVNDLRFLHLPTTYPKTRLLFLRFFASTSLKRATRIIAISEDTKKDIVNGFGLPADKIDVVHISLDPKFRPTMGAEQLSKIRRRYGLPQPFILYVGHLEPRKNLRRLVQAFGQIQRDLNHHLVILGRPNYRYNVIYQIAEESGFSSRIHFTGYVADSDLAAIYMLADLLAFPSLHEGFGVPVLEAMACGTPVVTSNVSALPEVAGDAAFLVNPYSDTSIAEGISRVLSNKVLRHSLIEKGLERIKDFNPDEAASRIFETYRKATSVN